MDNLFKPIRFRNFVEHKSEAQIQYEKAKNEQNIISEEEYNNCIKVLEIFVKNEHLLDDYRYHNLKIITKKLSSLSKQRDITVKKEQKKSGSLHWHTKILLLQQNVKNMEENAPMQKYLSEKLAEIEEEERRSYDASSVESTDAPAPEQYLGACFTCNQNYWEGHFFYKRFCPVCAALNWEKRYLYANLTGRIALITGARVKIGFEAALRLLRYGCDKVIITTRFPRDAVRRFSQEGDFDDWKFRLAVYPIDFRDLASVEEFIEYIKKSVPHLNILINNAAQTVRKPVAYYRNIIEIESVSLNEELERMIVQNDRHVLSLDGSSQKLLTSHDNQGSLLPFYTEDLQDTSLSQSSSSNEKNIHRSAYLAQIPLIEDDVKSLTKEIADEWFPPNQLDEFQQPIDTRAHNSWLMRLDQVTSCEVLEVFTINAIAPMLITSKLKSLLKADQPHKDKYVINVSAMEGKFYRFKTYFHPHTNSAKAALNMMTRTSAHDYAYWNIYMNAVDTGWVTDERPLPMQQRLHESATQMPLDVIDGAMRVLDPIFVGINEKKYDYGQFFKDYKKSDW